MPECFTPPRPPILGESPARADAGSRLVNPKMASVRSGRSGGILAEA